MVRQQGSKGLGDRWLRPNTRGSGVETKGMGEGVIKSSEGNGSGIAVNGT